MSALESIKQLAQESKEELSNFDWNDLSDIETIGFWPGIVKLVLAVVIFGACLGGGYWFHVRNLQATLAGVVAQEANLRADLESKAILAANLPAYLQQMEDMQEEFGSLLAQLPGETEVPGLLEDITFTGSGSGLEFSSIQLQNELEKEFYIELPINIVVAGGYHDFGTFVSGVASLDRIVTLHDFNIAGGDDSRSLSMTITAKTYRYNAGDE